MNNHKMHFVSRIAVLIAIIVLSAFCFIGYMNFAFAYSAVLGLPDKIEFANHANNMAWRYLVALLTLQFLGIYVATTIIRFENTDLQPILRYLARFGVSIFVVVFGTMAAVKGFLVLFHY